MKVHELKSRPDAFVAQLEGEKTYEIRVNDRNFQVRDILWLREWSTLGGYSGVELYRRVVHMTPGGEFGLPENLCVMGTNPVPVQEILELPL